MPLVPKSEIRAVLNEARARLERLTSKRAIVPLRKLHDEAVAELERKLAAIGKGSKTFEAHQHRAMLAQVRQGQAVLTRKMTGELAAASSEAQVEGVRSLVKQVTKLEGKFRGAAPQLPLEEAARLRGIVDKRRRSLLRAHETSMQRYGARVVLDVESQLSLSLATGEAPFAAAERVAETIDGEFWQAERIARTEVAWAFNAGHADSIAEAAGIVPDMMMRWSEHVDDFSGMPLDDRVGVDSEAMHGQVAPAGGQFTQPPTSPSGEVVQPSLIGKSWSWPPNRPNDRSVLQPWMKHWGIPGWTWNGSARVPA